MKLVIGSKRVSSWSLRPWLLLRVLGIPFDEVLIPLDRPETRASILAHSPTGRVPALVDGDLTVWDSLAIVEYVAEALAPGRVWPADPTVRATARSVAAEMHAGFSALRTACPMDLGRRFAARDRGVACTADVARIEAIVSGTRGRFGAGGPFLFGAFSAADAMLAPVATRIDTYAIPVDAAVQTWVETILALPAYRQWLAAALADPWRPPVAAGETVTAEWGETRP